MSSRGAGPGKRSIDVVDGGGVYFARVVSTGSLAFLAGGAVDESGAIAPAAQVPPPYALSPVAHAIAQTRFTFDRYRRVLEDLGSGINEVLQVEQYIPHKIYANGYLETSRGPGFMDSRRPTSALVCIGDLTPEGCVVNLAGIAVLPAGGAKEVVPTTTDYQASLTSGVRAEAFQEEGPYNEVVVSDDYIFTVGQVAVDYETGSIPDEVRVPDWVWWGSEIRNEAHFVLRQLRRYLERLDASLDEIVHMTVYLSDLADLFELDLIWREYFPSEPPSRTVVPVRGFGVPRLEAPSLGHRDGAVRLEQIAVAVRPGGSGERRVVAEGEVLHHHSQAVRVGDLLWISGQLAGGPDGLRSGANVQSQLEHLFERLDAICAAGGTSIANLVRLRAFLLDPRDAGVVYQTLKRVVPSDPPTVVVAGVPGPFQVPGCTVLLDGVAYVPTRGTSAVGA